MGAPVTPDSPGIGDGIENIAVGPDGGVVVQSTFGRAQLVAIESFGDSPR